MAGLQQLQELKAQSPNAKGMSDIEFALALHKHYYSDMPLTDFLTKNGLDPAQARGAVAEDSPYSKYLQEEDTRQQMARRSQMPTGKEDVGNLEGIARSVGQGVTLGFGDELMGAAKALTSDIGSPDYWANLGQRYAEAQAEEQRRLKAYEQKEPGFAGVSEFVGSVLPGVVAAPFTGGASLAPSLGRAALLAGVSGGIYGYGKAEDPNDPGALISGKRLEAAIPTAALSALGGAAGAKVASMVRPVKVNPANQAAADVLESAGVKSLTAGQKTGSEAVQMLESRAGKKIANLLENQKEEFANAIWKDLGVERIARLSGNRTSRGVFNKADDAAMQTASKIYTEAYEKLESFPMLIDRQLGADLSNIAAAYRKYTPGASFGLSEISPTVREMILKIKTAARRGAVAADGTLYNDIYKKLGEEIADPATSAASKKALGEIQDALSEAMRRGIQASGGGRKAEALLDELRGSFQKYMAVRNASVSKIDGKYFDPAALLSAVKTIDDDALKFGTGRLANMANLSKAADTVGFALKEAPKDQRFALRYTVPGLAGMAAPSLFGVTGTLAAPAAGLAGLLGYGTARLGEKAFRGAEAGLAASKLGQSVLSNQAGPGITSLVRGTGEGISAAAPYAGQAISDTFGLGNLSEASLPF